jgi:hypothetical protein
MTPTLARLNRLAECLGTVTFDPALTNPGRYSLVTKTSTHDLGTKGEDARRTLREMLAPKSKKVTPPAAHAPVVA